MLFSALGGYATFQAGVYDRIITGGLKQTREHQEDGTWVGWTERDLRARFGAPTMEYPYPHGPARNVTKPARTLLYFHRQGSLYVWLNTDGEGAVCFDSVWLDTGYPGYRF